MMLAWLLAAAIAPPAAGPPAPLAEARHAIEVGRLDQARLMIGKAVSSGARGPAVDRLLADLAFASGRMTEAASGYATLAAAANADIVVVERAGIAALRTGDIAGAERWIRQATARPGASWRAWNAFGVIADYRKDFAEADRGYAKATELAPDEAEVVNNVGWSLLLRGEWERAAAELERAHSLDPASRRIADNLELARAAISQDLPSRGPRESAEDWAARLNDAGVVAGARGDHARAIAAFTRAVEARSSWFERAANNLKEAQAAK